MRELDSTWLTSWRRWNRHGDGRRRKKQIRFSSAAQRVRIRRRERFRETLGRIERQRDSEREKEKERERESKRRGEKINCHKLPGALHAKEPENRTHACAHRMFLRPAVNYRDKHIRVIRMCVCVCMTDAKQWTVSNRIEHEAFGNRTKNGLSPNRNVHVTVNFIITPLKVHISKRILRNWTKCTSFLDDLNNWLNVLYIILTLYGLWNDRFIARNMNLKKKKQNVSTFLKYFKRALIFFWVY